ncbi:MAG TPA: photosynthetic reaction center cytochrome c subunit family protein [Thermoanaerobaculia bacterium]|nr:photosynthetic reaction center cytochrome c subunit family protein [Thermoanaerobaculia bacterium]
MRRLALVATVFAFASSCALRDAAVEQRRLPRRPEVDVTSVGVFRAWTGPGDPPAEERFQNIRVLRGLPSSELYPVMAFFANSLGVTCEHCHSEHFSEDTKHTKRIARQMVLLTRAINQAQFQGEPTVTCHTCHDGRPYPSTVPQLDQAGWVPTPQPDVRPLPSVEEVLRRYRDAAGAFTMLRASGTLEAVGGLAESLRGPFTMRWTRGSEVEIETLVDYPPPIDARLSEVQLGTFDPSSRYGSFDVLQRESIDGIDAVTLLGETEEGVLEWVSFDALRGNLVRVRTGTPTELGFVPEEIRIHGWSAAGPRAIEWARGDWRVTFTF